MSEGLTLNQLAERNALLVTENAALQQKLNAVLAENAALKGFFETGINASFEGCDFFGGDMQSRALALGLIREEVYCKDQHDNLVVDSGNFEDGDTVYFINDTPETDAIINAVRAEAIPEGYALVPQQMCLSANAMEAICFHCGDGDHMFGEFTDGILWVGEIDHDDGTKTYGLNIATADYPDEGSGVVSEFIKPLRANETKGGSDE